MGFAFMEAFMDSVEVESELGKGTRVRMKDVYKRQHRVREKGRKRSGISGDGRCV